MFRTDIFDKFEKIKLTDDYVLLGGSRKIMLSCPHSVEHKRNGKIRPAESDTALIALHFNSMGFPCIIKTSNLDDDANFDKESKYKTDLISFINQNKISLVLDLHELRRDREMDICIGTGSDSHKNLLGNLGILQRLETALSEDFSVRINDPFMASSDGTVSSACALNGTPALQLEINSGLFLSDEKCERLIGNLGRFLQTEGE